MNCSGTTGLRGGIIAGWMFSLRKPRGDTMGEGCNSDTRMQRRGCAGSSRSPEANYCETPAETLNVSPGANLLNPLNLLNLLNLLFLPPLIISPAQSHIPPH